MVRAKEHTRDKLLGIACRHFATKGFAATSLRDIGGELSMANASLLYHFPSMRRIYAAVLEQIAEGLTQVAVKLEGRAITVDRAAVAEALMRWADAHPAHVRIVTRELLDVSSEPERAARAQRWYLAEPVDRLARLMGGRDRHVALLHMVGSISYFAVATPTLAHMLGRSDKTLTSRYRRHLRQQLAVRGD